MKRILLSLLLLGLPLAVLADGKVFPATAYPASVTIPDQRALLCWSNGMERLVIETRFTGEGTNFAWVVPLPSQPVIEEATPGLFNTLEFIFRPTIIHNVAPWFLILVTCAGAVYLLAVVRRNTPSRISDTLVAVLVALAITPVSACAGVPLLVLLPYVVWRIRSGSESPWAILLILLLALLLGSMLLPALGTAGGAMVSGQVKVSILGRETIGAYDTTTISSKEPQALIEWLQANGYVIPPAANPIVSNYVSRGWVFVATKLRRDLAGQLVSTPQPLCFTFQSEKAVYPMQLTGVGSTNLTVDLFVFGPLRAEADLFRTDCCVMPIFPETNNYSWRVKDQQQLRIVHPLLRKWVSGFPVATKLCANLTSGMMGKDVELRWVSFTEARQEIYSRQGAATVGLNYGVSIFLGVLSLICLLQLILRKWPRRLRVLFLLASIAGIVTAGVIYIVLPKISVRLIPRPSINLYRNMHQLGGQFRDENQNNPSASLPELRVMFKNIQDSMPEPVGQNVFFGGPIREEDSPGNYQLRQGTNGVEFIWFDANGGKHGLDR